MKIRKIPKLSLKDKKRFLSYINFTKNCWNFKIGKTTGGYCLFGMKGKVYRAHRIAYQLFMNIELPLDRVIDHLCRVTNCVNPSHLEIVTHRENSLRGYGVGAIAARRNTCIKGHAYTESNTWMRFREGRWSRTCRRCAAQVMTLRRRKKGIPERKLRLLRET